MAEPGRPGLRGNSVVAGRRAALMRGLSTAGGGRPRSPPASSTHVGGQRAHAAGGVDVLRALGGWRGGKGSQAGGAGMVGRTHARTRMHTHSGSTPAHTCTRTAADRSHSPPRPRIRGPHATGLWKPGASAHTLRVLSRAELLSHAQPGRHVPVPSQETPSCTRLPSHTYARQATPVHARPVHLARTAERAHASTHPHSFAHTQTGRSRKQVPLSPLVCRN